MASILRVISTINSRAIKPSFNTVKHVREKFERRNKEHAERNDEEVPQEKGKGKLRKDP